MSGFAGDNTRIRFFLPDGTSFQTRPIPCYEVEQFTGTPKAVSIACLLMLVCLFGASGKVLTPDFVLIFQALGAFLCFAHFVMSLHSEKQAAAWKEVVVYLICAYLLQISVTHGFPALFTKWMSLLALLGTILVGISYVADVITRRIWEPLACAALFLLMIIAICVWKQATVLYAMGAAITILLFSIVSLIVLLASSEAYEHGLNQVDDG